MIRQGMVTLAAVLVAAAFVACRAAPSTGDIVAADLISEFEHVDCRPTAACTVDGHGVPAVRVAVPSRIVWRLPLPPDGHLEVRVAAAEAAQVRFRIGISDDRVYERLQEVTLAGGSPPVPLDVGLSAYAGRKWSLFYHPDRIVWQLTFSTDAIDGPTHALWQQPEILTTAAGALAFEKRRSVPR